MDNFIENMELLLNFNNNFKCPSFVCLDANINLLDLNNMTSINYYNCLMNCGFIPVNTKATRMQGGTSTFIDHILSNVPQSCKNSGSIIDDLSDHWLTFMQLNSLKSIKKTGVHKRRLMNTVNLNNFCNNLSNLAWNDVLQTNDVDNCYNRFWGHFENLYDLNFPMVTTRTNRNYHKISDFMTQGLVVSRRTKINLLKMQLNHPNQQNIDNYKKYRNLYNKLIRIRKRDHFNEKLQKSQKNPKKTWELLCELTGGKNSKSSKISKVCSVGSVITGDRNVANEFNRFFCNIGEQIANSVENMDSTPEDFMVEPGPNSLPLEFGTFTQAEFITIINNMEPKSSVDIDGLSTKLLKFIKFEIATPLVHLINLSFRTGLFPSKLKTSRTVLSGNRHQNDTIF
jgi:hypothetical protein